jgi:hypothetical protein
MAKTSEKIPLFHQQIKEWINTYFGFFERMQFTKAADVSKNKGVCLK